MHQKSLIPRKRRVTSMAENFLIDKIKFQHQVFINLQPIINFVPQQCVLSTPHIPRRIIFTARQLQKVWRSTNKFGSMNEHKHTAAKKSFSELARKCERAKFPQVLNAVHFFFLFFKSSTLSSQDEGKESHLFYFLSHLLPCITYFSKFLTKFSHHDDAWWWR